MSNRNKIISKSNKSNNHKNNKNNNSLKNNLSQNSSSNKYRMSKNRTNKMKINLQDSKDGTNPSSKPLRTSNRKNRINKILSMYRQIKFSNHRLRRRNGDPVKLNLKLINPLLITNQPLVKQLTQIIQIHQLKYNLMIKMDSILINNKNKYKI